MKNRVAMGTWAVIAYTLGASNGEAQSLEETVDTFVQRYVDQNVFSGVVLLARDGDVLLEKGYGMSSYELAVPVEPSHRFRTASVSKAFTDVALLRLIQDGRLAWDDPLSRFIPNFPRASEITVRHLATNRSGIPHINDLDWYKQFEFREWTLEEIVERLKTEELAFEPGSESRYSNGGFAVLALVIEQATGMRFGDALEEIVFRPAGMADTGHEMHNELVPSLAKGYTLGVDGIVPAPYVEMSLKIGGGSVYSTARDLFRFDRAIRDGRLIDKSLTDSLFPTIESPTGRPRVYHGGRAPGYTAAVQRFVEHDALIVVLSNNYSRLNEEISDGLAGILFGGAYENRLRQILSRERFRSVAVDSSQLMNYVGAWKHAWGFGFDLHVHQGSLIYRDPERGMRHRLIPLAPSIFVSPWQWARIEFHRADDGSIGSATWTWLDFPEKEWQIEHRDPAMP